MLKVYHIKHDFVIIQNKDYDILLDPFEIDPEHVRLLDKNTPNILMFTHTHSDHFSITSVGIIELQTSNFHIVAPLLLQEIFLTPTFSYLLDNVTFVEPNKKYKIPVGQFPDPQITLNFSTVPAYNLNKFRENNTPYHPKESGFVGYLIELEKTYMQHEVQLKSKFIANYNPTIIKTIFHPGDSDNIPEYKKLQNKVDLFFVPVSGKYVMDVKEACEATKVIKPNVAIPMHYGFIVGTDNDAKQFVETCKIS